MRGITVQLVQKVQTGTDPFGAPIYEEELVGQPSSDDQTESIALLGKRIDYVLGIPTGDDHNWGDTDVMFFGMRFKTVGLPQKGIPDNIPLRWKGGNVKVVHYE